MSMNLEAGLSTASNLTPFIDFHGAPGSDLAVLKNLQSCSPDERSALRQSYQMGYIQEEELRNSDFVRTAPAQIITAIHEAGHGLMVKAKRGFVSMMSIEPVGNVLGITHFILNSGRGFVQNIYDHLSIAPGGQMAVELFGLRSRGHGSDKGSQRFSARLACLFTSQSELEAQFGGDTDARETLAGYGRNFLMGTAMSLFRKRVIYGC